MTEKGSRLFELPSCGVPCPCIPVSNKMVFSTCITKKSLSDLTLMLAATSGLSANASATFVRAPSPSNTTCSFQSQSACSSSKDLHHHHPPCSYSYLIWILEHLGCNKFSCFVGSLLLPPNLFCSAHHKSAHSAFLVAWLYLLSPASGRSSSCRFLRVGIDPFPPFLCATHCDVFLCTKPPQIFSHEQTLL